MRLQQLEIKGFKSFANHTIINFNEDITGIVGPNGSGKSNLVDAIRWVLGEQKTKDLRTEKMENVIFNGTNNRKKSGRAYVGLNFINDQNKLPSEYHEIVISRTLYRSGESEYRLNNTKCRLKDIKNLFLDTGIGSDSYAIISLGMVDEILLDRENFRRKMLEQAAGIEKYRVRKRKTMLKLDRTEEDLDRLLDLLHEVEINMKTLKQQANRAKRYKDIKEKYKSASLEYTKYHVDRIEKESHQANQDHERLSKDFIKLRSLIAQLEKDIEEQKLALLNEEKDMGANQAKLNALMNEIRERETEKSVLQERKRFLGNQKETSERQLSQGDEDLDKLAASRKGFESKFEQAQADLQLFKEKLDVLDARRKEMRDSLDSLSSTLNKVVEGEREETDALKGLQLKKARIEEKLITIDKNAQLNLNNIESNKGSRAVIEKNVVVHREQLAITEKEISDLELQKTKNDERFAELNVKIEETRKKTNKVKQRISGLESELNLTNNMVENLEGYPEAVKTLSKNKQLKGSFELFSDIINIEDQYKSGLELFLSGYINSLVSNSSGSAFSAVQILRDSQGGKVDIIFKGQQEVAWKEMQLAGAVRVLDILEFDKKYKDIVESIFTNVYLVEELPELGKVEEGIVLIESTGERILSAGRLRGGSKGLFEGKKLGRKKNIELLEKNLKQLNDKAFVLGQKLDELLGKRNKMDLKKFDAELDSLVKKRQSLHASLAVDEDKLLRIEKDIEEYATMNERSMSEKNELAKEIELLKEQIELLNRKGLKRDDRVEEMKNKIGTLRSKKEERDREYNDKNISYLRQENLVHSLKKEIEVLDNREKDHHHRLSEAKKTLETNTKEITEIGQKLNRIDQFLETKYREKKELGESLNKEESEYYRKKEAVVKLEKQSRDSSREGQRITDNLSSIDSRRQELRFNKKEYLNRLEIEFDAEIMEELKELQIVSSDQWEEDKNKAKIERFKSQMRSYGEINPLAIESYEEVKARYEELTEQRNDIVNAKTSLLSTIDEIEEEAEQRFETTFQDVRENFKKVFRSLFTDQDECDLYLEDAEDQLNSKIKIIAKPKGKRPQSINQLSGGEKALTSTAFLFALYLLKPAPFCIFDEVDAPLDDHNILKFNKIIKEFSKESQFIIITHNKLSMSNVDVIYGITMGEEGVSQISGVDFRKLKNPAIGAS